MANLFIQTAYLGDLFLSIPTLRRIKKLYPDEKLVLFCRKGFGQTFLELGLIDEFIEIDKSKNTWKDAKKELQKESYNLIVSVHQSFRTALIVSQIKANVKIGYSAWWNFWAYSSSHKRIMNWPEPLRQLALLSSLDSGLNESLEKIKNKYLNENTQRDIKDNKAIPEWASLSIRTRILENKINLEKFGLPQKFIVIAPGSVWPTKRWTESGYKKLIQQLPMPCVLIGSSNEAEICNTISKEVEQTWNLCGQTTLLETLNLMTRASLTISNDSGAQHMSSAAECPTLSLFGPTVLDLGYRPWHHKVRVAEIDLNCRPCGKHGAKVCPLGTHDCMRKLSVQKVRDLALELL